VNKSQLYKAPHLSLSLSIYLSLSLFIALFLSGSVSLLSACCTDINNIMAAIEERMQTKAERYEKQQPTV